MSLEGLEPSWVLPRRILSPLRLPIPPQARGRDDSGRFYPISVPNERISRTIRMLVVTRCACREPEIDFLCTKTQIGFAILVGLPRIRRSVWLYELTAHQRRTKDLSLGEKYHGNG